MRRQFDRAAASYDAAAVLAQETGRRLADRLQCVKIKPGRMADVGCATGDGILNLVSLQPAGKKAMSAQDLLNSRREWFVPGNRLV